MTIFIIINSYYFIYMHQTIFKLKCLLWPSSYPHNTIIHIQIYSDVMIERHISVSMDPVVPGLNVLLGTKIRLMIKKMQENVCNVQFLVSS
jgi:hypothetical protein